jgi:hypothetical protein
VSGTPRSDEIQIGHQPESRQTRLSWLLAVDIWQNSGVSKKIN